MTFRSEVYVFTDNDIAVARRMAFDRQDKKKEFEVVTKKMDPAQSDWRVMYVGCLGEIAVSKYLGTPLDKRTLIGGDEGYDTQLPCGLTVEVRTCSAKGRNFALNGPDLNLMKADVGILVRLEEGAGVLLGWTTRVRMAMRATLRNFGYGERLALPADKLFPMSELRKLVE